MRGQPADAGLHALAEQRAHHAQVAQERVLHGLGVVDEVGDRLHGDEGHAALGAHLRDGAGLHVLGAYALLLEECELRGHGIEAVAGADDARARADRGRQSGCRGRGPSARGLQREAFDGDAPVVVKQRPFGDVDAAHGAAACLESPTRARIHHQVGSELADGHVGGQRGRVRAHAVGAAPGVGAVDEDIDVERAHGPREVAGPQGRVDCGLLGEHQPLDQRLRLARQRVQHGDTLDGGLGRVRVGRGVHRKEHTPDGAGACSEEGADGRSRTADLGFMNPSL